MGLSKKTIAIAFVVVVVLIIVGVLLGVLLSKKSESHIELLQVWPRSADDDAQPLIQYKSGDRNSSDQWVGKINSFLEEYRKTNETRGRGIKSRVVCTNTTKLGENQVCNVPVDEFYPCAYGNHYSFHQAGVCVFLKLNKILDWKPQTYDSTELPQNMPEDLKQYIRNFKLFTPNTVWVSCEGESPKDAENLKSVEYIPRRGFPAYYFPFTNKEGYLSPLVAVSFKQPEKGVMINIVCKAWAKNIAYENGGSVHFKLMVE